MARSGSKPGKVYKFVHFEDVYIKTNPEGLVRLFGGLFGKWKTGKSQNQIAITEFSWVLAGEGLK